VSQYVFVQPDVGHWGIGSLEAYIKIKFWRRDALDELPERQSQTRRHHYVPAFLLQGLTPSGERDDFLWVHDQERGRSWRAKPDNAAHERDYYRVEIPDAGENRFHPREQAQIGSTQWDKRRDLGFSKKSPSRLVWNTYGSC
jgi:hypothetical protein